MTIRDENAAADENDHQTVRDWLFTRSMAERGEPLEAEMKWVLLERPNAEEHQKLLPEYCYNIFEVVRKTIFKGIPSQAETIQITDQTAASSAKTLAEAKKVLQLDWRNLGRAVGMLMRCLRFVELEAKDKMDEDGFDHLTLEKKAQLAAMIFGGQWTEEHREKLAAETPGQLVSGMLNQKLAPEFAMVTEKNPYFDSLSFQWSAEAMIEFKTGMGEGTTCFLDEHGNLTGESNRAGIYIFLALAWPEIKALLESNDRKTVRDLHEWMQPFMRVGMVTKLDLEQLRDVCSPPPHGIGLSLSPLKPRRQRASD